MKCYRLCLTGLLIVCLSLVSAQEREDRQQAERQNWFYEQRRFPLGHIPTGARLSAIEELGTIPAPSRPAFQATNTRAATTDPANWSLIGPQPTGAGTNYVTAGRVNAIAVDPRNNDVVYIGAAEGGVWRTTDGGVTWKPLTDNQPSLANGSIVLDPNNPDIVYVGTGEENFSQDSYYGAGILKSTDGGATWTNLVGPFLRAQIGSLTISPDSQTLLCTTQTGVWRSADGAETWKQVLGAFSTGTVAGTAVVFDPTDASIAYAALGWFFGNSHNGVYLSKDGGLTWERTGGAAQGALPTEGVGRISLAVDPTAPATVYAALQDAGTADFGKILGLWKTTNRGNIWTQLTAFPADFCAEQCWYDMTIAVDPQNPNIVIAGGLLLVRSMDGGTTWQGLPYAGADGNYIHVDQHFLSFTPDGTTLYIANDGGMYSTADVANTAVTWSVLNDTLAITQFYPGLAVDPTNVENAIGGTQDNGTQQFAGASSWSELTCGDGGYTAIDPAAPAQFFAACHDIEIERTSPSGVWLPAVYGIDQTDRSEFIAPLTLDAANPSTLYFGTYRVWRTQDGAGRWNAMSPDLTLSSSDVINTVAVAPSDSNVIYVGTAEGGVQVTGDASGGASAAAWVKRTSGLPVRTVTRIVVDPIDAMTAYVTFSGFSMGSDAKGHIFETTDGGAAWTDISGNLPNIPVNDLVVDPDLPGVLYAGTDAGVMITKDSGRSWALLGAGLPLVVVESLALQRPARVLRAATHGRSVWEIAVPLATASLQPVITMLTPSQANAGAAGQTVAVAGSGFAADTVVRWNGRPLLTKVVDASDLTVQVPASAFTKLGQAAVQAFSPAPGGGASNPLYFVIGPAPFSGTQAFVNAAYPLGGNVLAPGTIASLYGSNFSTQTVIADLAPPLPVTLGGVTITIATYPVPLFFVSPTQINFQVPYFGIFRETPVTLRITQGSSTTNIPVTLGAESPALFTANAQGSGQASALIAGTASMAAPIGMFTGSRPAHAGEYVSLYCTGLGSVTNTPYESYPALSDPFSMTDASPTVTIGGAPATVVFSGLAPGYVGLYQVNVQIPAGLAGGDAVPVILTIGGVPSNTATIAVE
jgi:uncharacterized protein (TIGR03437 family)